MFGPNDSSAELGSKGVERSFGAEPLTTFRSRQFQASVKRILDFFAANGDSRRGSPARLRQAPTAAKPELPAGKQESV